MPNLIAKKRNGRMRSVLELPKMLQEKESNRA